MDTAILEVVLGLALVYLVLALLVSKLQETVQGTWRGGRTNTLQQMVLEAVGRDEGLKQRLFDNPLIFALSKGPNAAKSGAFATGPSSMPSALFAKVLLIELYNDGKGSHPSSHWDTPGAFVRERFPGSKAPRIWESLRSLVGDGETMTWEQFEAAIAEWFNHIGDRANGWYQRSARRWSFGMALALAILLGVDTFALADRLANEPLLRRTLSTLAQQVNAIFPGGQDAPASGAAANAPVPPAALAPALRADIALQKASADLVGLYFGNSDIAKWDVQRQTLWTEKGQNQPDLITRCAKATRAVEKANADGLSAPVTWVVLLPQLRAFVKERRLPSEFATDALASTDPSTSPASASQGHSCKRSGKKETGDCGSGGNSGVNQEAPNAAAITAAVSAAKPAGARDASKPDENRQLRIAYSCIANVVGWVGVAEGATDKAEAQGKLRSAALNLDQAAEALLEIISDQGTGMTLKQLFRADPEAFKECARQNGMTRTRLRQCVAAAAVGRVDLPLGWTARNIRLAYCTPHEKGPGETVPVATSCLRNQDAIFTGQPGLGIGEVWLEGPGFSDGFIALCGFWLTALFVSMGAPFWFDLLGRVVKLRAAGTRASEDTSPQATATSPPATPAKTGGSSSDNLALNDFERDLGKDDIVFLQQSVGAPETGVLDGATRDAIVAKKKALAQAGKYATGDVSAELSVASYFALTDRLPKSRATTATGFQSTSVDQPDAQAAPLALRLEDHMLADIKGSVTHPLLRFTADLRALTVLYRYKRDKAANVPLMDREVVKAARSKGVLDTLPADFAKGLPDKDTLYPRETPAWLDWALGELGQLEKNLTTREGSNPRVIEYLDAAGMPRTAGDATAWCGAFVNWVFKKYNRLPPKDGRLVANTPAGPAAAHAWAGWGTEVWTLAADTADDRPGPMQPGDWTTCGVQPGDILLTRSRDRATWRAKAQQDQAGNPRGIAHVAFVLAIDAAAPGVLLALGGNQDSGTTVCVSRFPNNDDEVVCVRRPRLLDPLAG